MSDYIIKGNAPRKICKGALAYTREAIPGIRKNKSGRIDGNKKKPSKTSQKAQVYDTPYLNQEATKGGGNSGTRKTSKEFQIG